MQIDIASLAFAGAALCAAAMGFALQRGGTCTVAAIEELVQDRTAWRIAALLEASLWVAGGLVLAEALHLMPSGLQGYAVTGSTLLGGALLGLGAFVNGACVFGAVGRIGSGQWVYLLAPIGYFAGCVAAGRFLSPVQPAISGTTSLLLMAPLAAALGFGALAMWRVGRPVLALRRTRSAGSRAEAPRLHRALAAHAWSPHGATTVIGLAFVGLFLLVGAWAYTDVLADAARGTTRGLLPRALLLLALVAGAVAGGVSGGQFRSIRVGPASAARCLAGGMLMGWGSLLVPGGNDGLVLVGMPLLWPYAWAAFAAMALTIALAMLPRAVAGSPARTSRTRPRRSDGSGSGPARR